MRKYCLFLLLLLTTLVLVPASLVFAQGTYRAEISVTDNTSADRYGVGSLIPFNSEGAVSLGQMLSTGLDTRMFEGTTEIDYMVADDKIGIFIPSLVANQERSYKFETGYAPANDSFSVILGYGGYVTVADNTSTDFSTNGSVAVRGGWLDTSTPGDMLFRKAGALRAYVGSESGNVTIGSTTGTWVSPTGGAGDGWGDNALAYDENTGTFAYRSPANPGTFTYEATIAATNSESVRWWCTDTATVSNFIVSVYYDGEYHKVYENVSYTQGAWVMMGLSGIKSVTKVKIDFVLSAGGGTVKVHEIDITPIYNTILTTSGVGDHISDIMVATNMVNWLMEIDGVTVDTMEVGTGLYDSSGNWTFMENDSCADNVTIVKNGTPVIWYQPNDIIRDSILPNRASTGDDGVITWGSNVGEDIEIGGLKTISSYISTSVESSLPPVVVSAPGDITGFYPEEEDIEAMPFYDLFYRAVTGDHGLGWTTNTLYGVMGIFVGIGIGVGVAVATGSALLAAIAVGIGLAVAAGTGTVGYWVVLVYALFAGTFIVVSRSM